MIYQHTIRYLLEFLMENGQRFDDEMKKSII